MTTERNLCTPPADLGRDATAAADIIPAIREARFPLRMSFKILTLDPTVTVTDSTGRVILHVRQQLLRLKEQVEIFADTGREHKVAHIAADHILDWSARYNFTEANGRPIGSTGRRGTRSLWRARYDVFNPGDNSPDFTIREVNPMVKVVDSIVGDIPVAGMLSAFLFHPKYAATRANGPEVMRLTKQPAFFEERFLVEKLADLTDRKTMNLLLAFLMLVLLERQRG